MRTAKRTPLIHAGRAFVLALAAGLVLVGCMEWSRRNQERDRMGYVASAIGAETYEFMLSEMSKTRVLEAYLIQTSGDYSDFGRVAHVLLREDYVRNVLFAPDGIVDGVFPLEGNEDVVGLNMYGDGAGNLEAQAAIEKEALYIAGPFQLIQGGLGIAGRLPVFLGHCLRDAGLSGRPVRKLRGAGKCPGLRLPNLAHQSGRRTETGDS